MNCGGRFDPTILREYDIRSLPLDGGLAMPAA